MRILVAHNRYRIAAGEDAVVRNETGMLTSHGHEVATLVADNASISGFARELRAATSLFHSTPSRQALHKLLDGFPADIIHVHNWFPLLSPDIIAEAAAFGIPVVQTLHNFRMSCANAVLYRDGGICQQCVGKRVPLDGIIHRCYRDSYTGSALVTAAFAYHREIHTWDRVARFVALSEFQRTLLVRGGLPADRIALKPNFVPDIGPIGKGDGGYFLFVGRLTPEKGIRTVLRAWEDHGITLPLRIAGDGPLRDEVTRRAAEAPGITFLGPRSPRQIATELAGARALIFASEWYEPFALAIIEAFSHGTPVIAADLESIHSLIRPQETGYLFSPRSAADLAAAIALLSSDEDGYRAMRASCRRTYQASYTPEANYPLLLEIYEQAIATANGHRAKLRPGLSTTAVERTAKEHPAAPLANVLGFPVHAVNMEHTLNEIHSALNLRRKGYVLLAGAHGIMEARRRSELRTVAANALLVVPDGMPAVWIGRMQGFASMDRVFGPDLMVRIFEDARFSNARHYLWGGQPGVAERLAVMMRKRFASIEIVGAAAPPFVDMTPAQMTSFASEIAGLKPDIIWVGVSTPKQDRLMAQVLPQLDTTLMIGVGAAFLYHTGALRDSPRWVKRAGLQWLHRLLQEPRRLWKRYLLTVPSFACHALLQWSGARTYSLPTHCTPAPAAAPATTP